MKNPSAFSVSKAILYFAITFSPIISFAQEQTKAPKSKSDFWQRVQFGGGFGLNIGSGFTDVTLAPSAIYNVNDYVAVGLGVQGTHVSSRNHYNSYIYGGSLIGLFNPIEEVQLSVEIEQLRVNTKLLYTGGDISDNFWNTSLFLGGGYRSGNVTVGGRFDVLFDEDKTVYGSAFMPFVRVYF